MNDIMLVKYMGYTIEDCEIFDSNLEEEGLYSYKLGYHGTGRVEVTSSVEISDTDEISFEQSLCLQAQRHLKSLDESFCGSP